MLFPQDKLGMIYKEIVYTLASKRDLETWENDLLSRGNNFVSCGNNLLTSRNDSVSCGSNLLTCGSDLLSHGNNLLSCGIKIKMIQKRYVPSWAPLTWQVNFTNEIVLRYNNLKIYT